MSVMVDIATTILKKAVLDVMPKDKSIITTAIISKKAEIYRKGKPGGLNDAIAQGILNSLSDEGYVSKIEGGWKLR